MSLTQRLAERTAKRLSREDGISRRSFMVRTAVVGSAIAVAPRRFLFQPVTAYAALADLCGSATGCDQYGNGPGYSVFCCTVNNGKNECPQGTFVGGWWRASPPSGLGSSWCCGRDRFYIDCHGTCSDGIHSCSCGGAYTNCPGCTTTSTGLCNGGGYCNVAGPCDYRSVCQIPYRYLNCNLQTTCVTNVVCRIVSCIRPDMIAGFGCNPNEIDNDWGTAEMSAPCLQQASWLGGAASIRGDGQFINSPAVAEVRGTTQAYVFTLRSNGLIYMSKQNDRYVAWSSWAVIGPNGQGAPPPGVNGSPAAVSWGPGNINVFVRGNDNKLWQTYSTDGGITWPVWTQPLGNVGVLNSNPGAVSWGAGRLDVFIVGTDNNLYHCWYSSGAWNGFWEPQGRPGPGIFGHPSAASWGVGRIDIFVRDSSVPPNGGRLWQKFYDNGWSGWIQPAGTQNGVLTSVPEAASWRTGGVNQLAVFGRGTDGGLWWTNYFKLDPNWSGWARIGNPGDSFQFDPRPASRDCQQLDVFVRGNDNLCYRYQYAG